MTAVCDRSRHMRRRAGLLLAIVAAVACLLRSEGVSAEDKSGVGPNSISLPSGPGSLQGLGESFQPALNTGTARYQVSIPTPPGPAGLSPRLVLAYDGGSGNGPLGFGWTLDVPSIQRRTDDGIPRYVDGPNDLDDDFDGGVDEPDEMDVFSDGGREELTRTPDGYYFRANEGPFIRYRRAGDHWVGQQPDGTRLEYGVSPAARLADPASGRTYRWLLERQIDPNGNTILYTYASFADEQNANQKYLAVVRYGPGAPPWPAYHFVAFKYEGRPDWFEDGRAGFLIRTGKRLAEVAVGTQGVDLPGHQAGDFDGDGTPDALDRLLRLAYGAHPHWSLLASARWLGADGTSALPPTTFDYLALDAVPVVSAEGRLSVIRNAPPRVMDTGYVDLVDLNGDALPDLLETRALAAPHRAYLNQDEQPQACVPAQASADVPAITWSGAIPVGGDAQAQAINLENSEGAIAHLADMDADGAADLVYTSNQAVFYFPNQPQAATPASLPRWGQQRRMATGTLRPPSPFGGSEAKTADVDFDKRMDVIESRWVANRVHYRIWFNLGNQRYSPPQDVIPPTGFRFSDAGVRIADLNGDRVPDMVRLSPSGLDITAGLGYGRFAPLRRMPLEVTLTPSQLAGAELQDLDGDGLADLVIESAASRELWYWLNQGNYTFDRRHRITGLPPRQTTDRAIRWADLNGNGTLDLIYGDTQAAQRLQMLDIGELLGAAPHPHLLTRIDNGFGRVTRIAYASSTEYLLADRAACRAWRYSLPFPVYVVSQVTVEDSLGGSYLTEYGYHDGYYDPVRKEFRGFAEVTETRRGDATAATTVSRYLYDVGDQVESRKGLLLGQALLGEGGDCARPESGCYRETRNALATYEVAAGVSQFSAITGTTTLIYENTTQPAALYRTFAYDEFGNQTEDFNWGTVCERAAGGMDAACGSDELLRYTAYARNLDDWIVNKPAVVTDTNAAGTVVSLSRLYYDGPDYTGLPLLSISRGNLVREERLLGPTPQDRFVPVRRQAVDAYGNVVRSLDPNGNLRSVGYDALLHSHAITESIHLAADRVLTYRADYDLGFGALVLATDYNGHSTGYGYDAFARLIRVVRPGDTSELPTEEFRYELSAPVSAITTLQREESGTPEVETSVTYFDGQGRKLQTRGEAEDGRVVVSGAVTFNARETVRDSYLPYYADGFGYHPPGPFLPRQSHEYDAAGRTIRTVRADGLSVSRRYAPLVEVQLDEEDNRPGSPHAQTPTTLRSDGLGRTVEVVQVNRTAGNDALYTTRYRYDALGRLVRTEDAQGNVKSMVYDGLGRLVVETDPDRGETRSAYDDAGNLAGTTDAKGQVIRYVYDAANRPLTELWLGERGATVAFRYHYDDDLAPIHPDARNTLGQVTYIEDAEGATYFSYDDRGRLAGRIRTFTRDDISLVLRTRYDALGRVSEQTYPDGFVVKYRYNARGELEAIPGLVAGIDYLASGQRQQIRYANGVRTLYEYDIRQRLSHLVSTAGPTVLQDLRYMLDGASNVTGIRDTRSDRSAVDDQTQQFAYDSMYRLIRASGAYGLIDYAYDSIGNLTRQSSTAADPRLNLGALRYGQNAGPHALTLAAGAVRRYDPNGNQVAAGERVLQWNSRDWLVSVTDGAASMEYAYDSSGQRVRQTVRAGGVVTTTLYGGPAVEVRAGRLVRYVYDDQQRIAEMTAPFARDRLLRGFADTAPASPPAADIAWYLADHLGGTAWKLDVQGQVRSTITYYPYGLTRSQTNGGDIPYAFTGKELDASGLYYFGARYYDPLVGRFISVDPLALTASSARQNDPQALAAYAYADANPLRFVDPYGLDNQDVWDRAGSEAFGKSNLPATFASVVDLRNRSWESSQGFGVSLKDMARGATYRVYNPGQAVPAIGHKWVRPETLGNPATWAKDASLRALAERVNWRAAGNAGGRIGGALAAVGTTLDYLTDSNKRVGNSDFWVDFSFDTIKGVTTGAAGSAAGAFTTSVLAMGGATLGSVAPIVGTAAGFGVGIAAGMYIESRIENWRMSLKSTFRDASDYSSPAGCFVPGRGP